ncbi:class I SAM-dependent DNA methyltransferase [Nostoc sp. MS1]|uniref:HsdM family class I SAM-dependent methyltransferase n=1 Tax=Nostoc sp. MS1 TaxID=2764711 RepID=UPI001CC5E6F9|nr:N-6 DNA methylase [Nostoc sp. MS1]BCL33613.1 type I endonuclease-methyltransferase fusion protein [Nostoc sp. MS1]
MSSNLAVNQIYQRVMAHTGFYLDGVPTTGVTEAEDIRNNHQYLEKRIKYSAVIDTEQINATAIYELSGSPCIYFTQLNEPNPRELAKLHKLSWNHGLAPMLWVITPNEVLLYNCYSQPTKQDENNPNRHLIESFETTDNDLQRMNQFASRLQIDSGEFWQWAKAKQIDRQQRVDSVLVRDLNEAEEKLTKEKKLENRFAHAILIRSVFVAYLQDRGILTQEFFKNRFGVDSFNELLKDKNATYQLFDWLQTIFNGDLFPVTPEEKNDVKKKHLEVVQSLIGGVEEIATGQQRLWRAYDFKVIPIELISSIYESFIHANDRKSAKENSTHYTPINLVNLVLSEVFKELDGNAKVLDLACGSGVFLVESLRRLVVKRWANGETQTRNLIRETLYNQIYGVDINPEAVQIAAFSLYLTALELDYELEQNRQLTDDLKFQKLIGKNLFANNAFDETSDFNRIEQFAQKKFDVIVGNPPWTKSKSKSNQLASQYCKRKRPEIGYSNGYPIARSDNPDQAFLWRVGDFAKDNARIGLILHGKPFFSPASKAQEAKKSLLLRFKPEVIINFSKLRNERLFPNSTAPAMVLIAKNKQSQPQDSFYFIYPESYLDSFRRHGIIEIGQENIKKLSIYEAAFDSDMLKVASWGNARDLNIIQCLRQSFPPLSELLNQEGWNFGRGFFAGSGGDEVPELYGKKFLPSSKMPRYKIDMNKLQPLLINKLERPRNFNIYKSPLVIATRGLKTSGFFSAFSEEDVVYVDTYIGISIPHEQTSLAHYLNGVLNSSLTNYFLFLTASSWGIERDEIKTQDLERLPFPFPDETNDVIINRIIEIERQLCEFSNQDISVNLQRQLDEAVFNLYGLNEEEKIIIQDKLKFTIEIWNKRKKSVALKTPLAIDLEAYAIQFMSVIKPFLQTLNQRSIVADIFTIPKTPLQVVKFSIVPYPGREPVIQTVQTGDLVTVLKSIAEQLPPQLADRVFTRRNARIYAGEYLYIIKPAQLRYWSRSVGLNDADTVLIEHFRKN